MHLPEENGLVNLYVDRQCLISGDRPLPSHVFQVKPRCPVVCGCGCRGSGKVFGLLGAEISPVHIWFMQVWALCLQFSCTLESAALIQPFNGCTCFLFP